MSTREEARDLVLGALKAAWEAGTPAIVGSVPPLYWQNVSRQAAVPNPPEAEVSGHVFMFHTTSARTTLATPARFLNRGVLQIRVRTPKGRGLTLSDKLVQMLKDLLDGDRLGGEVQITDARAEEIGVAGRSYEVNVLGDFEYEEVK